MSELNNYIFEVFSLIHKSYLMGLIRKPYVYKLDKIDKKVLKNIYNLDKLYSNNITINEFEQICINYSVTTGTNIINSGIEVASELKKIKITK